MSFKQAGNYATFRGVEFRISGRFEGQLTIGAGDPPRMTEGFSDLRGFGFLERIVQPEELSDPYRLSYTATWDGAPVDVSIGFTGKAALSVSDDAAAAALGFPRIDKFEFGITVPVDDPRLVITQHREPWDPAQLPVERRA